MVVDNLFDYLGILIIAPNTPQGTILNFAHNKNKTYRSVLAFSLDYGIGAIDGYLIPQVVAKSTDENKVSATVCTTTKVNGKNFVLIGFI